jgi:glycine cleavage system H protein
MAASEHTVLYKRARFVTSLPVDRLYSPSHFWIAEHEAGVWRVGFTRFATRMLGEIVEHEFQVEVGAPVESGQIIGWIEGFKAISDIYSVAEGKFAGGNPALTEKIELLGKEPYDAGWLYAIEGKPDSRCTDVHGYVGLLDATIDKMLEKQEYSEDV